jgi:hypothetical protein
MQACAAGHALTYLITLKLQLVSSAVEGLAAAKFESPILLVYGFFFSNIT